MVKPQKIWRLAVNKPDLQQLLAKELNITKTVARVMVNRGINSVTEGREFLWADLQQLHSPLLLPEMDLAVARIAAAINQGEKILVYGDYDVDGITSTAVVTLTLQRLGAQVDYYIPDREEGYGLNIAALEWAKTAGFNLIITVDCGISAVRETEWALQVGLDIIITDHHEVPEQLPRAVAVINPKREESQYPYRELAGAGVAFKLVQGLLQHYQPNLSLADAGQDLLDIVALGTVADIVPLRGENRIIVKQGLQLLFHTKRIGIQTLKEVCGLTDKKISAGQVGFILTPRINAAGRLGDAKLGVKLLLSTEREAALEIAQELDRENKERQEIEARIAEEAMEVIECHHDFQREKVIVLANTNWHPGIIGIVASRIVEKYHRPTILLVINGELAKGSCRSIPGFDMYHALTDCQDYLIKYGGHQQAAGLTMRVDQIEDFRREINLWADEQLQEEQLYPQVKVDGVIAFSELNLELVNQLELLEPFGHQNPGPVFACREAKVVECRGVGRESAHLKLRVQSEHGIIDAIGFQQGKAIEYIQAAEALDLAFALEKNEWNNRVKLQLNLKDLKASTLPDNPFKCWNIKLVDQRDCLNKDIYIVDMLTRGEQCLIYVNNAQTAEQLNILLNDNTANLLSKPASWKIYGPGWGEGITNYGVENVILYNLPFNNIELKKIIEYAGENEHCVSVHLLFNETDIALNRSILETRAPGREVLGQLYLLLRGLAQTQNPVRTDYSQLAAFLQLRDIGLEVQFNKVTIQAGLIIFEELGLLIKRTLPSGLEILLKAVPKQKLNLENAHGYSNGLNLKAEFERFGSLLLRAGTEELMKIFA